MKPRPTEPFTVGMRGFLALLLLGACAPSFEPLQVWVPEGHPLHAAQQVWGLPLRVTPELHEELPAAELPAVCDQPWKETVDGCARVPSGEIWIASDLPPERRAVARAHELGHLLGWLELSGQHLTGWCPGGHLMCPKGSESAEPTPEDFDFVLGM